MRPRPVSRLTAAPTANRATRLSPRLTRRTAVPPPNRYGMTGIEAPIANATNEPAAAPHGEPSSSGSSPSSSRTSMSRAVSGSRKIRWAILAASSGGEALGPVGGGQLGLLLLGHRLHLGPLERDLALEQLALALHRDVLAGGHAERPGEQAGDPGEQDEARIARTPHRRRP